MKNFPQIISFCALVVCILASNATATKYGATCESDTECDSTAFLTCQNGTCACQYPEDQILDHEKSSCVFKLGKECRGYSVPIEIAQRYNMTEFCVPNAKCSKSRICSCKEGYFQTTNETCEPNRIYGQSCTSNLECDSNFGFTCSTGGKCDCNSTTGFYDEFLKRCVAKFGSPCNSTIQCVNNSRCDYISIDSRFYRQTCVCTTTAFPTLEGTCELKRDHGGACSSSRECKSTLNLICENDTCQCKPDFIYNSTRSTCLSLVGTPCDRFTSSPCVTNAKCEEIRDRSGVSTTPQSYTVRSKPECQCYENYYMISNRTCAKKAGYNEQCSEEMPCRSKKPLELFCDSGRCKCAKNDTVYDEKAKECRKTIGSNCTWSNSDCVSTARCNNNKCTCGDYDALPDPTGKYCIAGFNSKCNATTTCDQEKGHICRDGRCQCLMKDHQYYDTRAKKCVTYVNGPCDQSTTSCVPNSLCISTETLGESECRCSKGFVPVNRLCEVSYGQPCNFTGYTGYDQGLRCDQMAPLFCTNGICQCAEYQYYDEAAMKCRGLVGAKCKVPKEMFLFPSSQYFGSRNVEYVRESDEFCVEGASCKGFRAIEGVKKTEGVCRCNNGLLKDENGRCFSKDEGNPKETQLD